jgi:quercetin dioxygenase-like cupin family protein
MFLSNPRSRPYTLQPGEAWTYRYGIDFDVKSSEIAPTSGVAVLEFLTRHGEEPGPHTHATEDEMFYVLDGWLSFHCDGQTFDLGPGGFIFLPRGLQHSYTIPPHTTVRLLVITAPVRDGAEGGWGGFVADMEKTGGALIKAPPDNAA